MKRTLLFLPLLLVFLLPAWAQRARYKPQVHELRLSGVTVQASPSYTGNYSPLAAAALTPLSSLRYVYHRSISDGFRLGLDRRSASFALSGLERFATYEADKKDWSIRLGYERKWVRGAGRAYLGADLVGMSSRVRDQGEILLNGGGTGSYAGSYVSRGLGASAVAGYHYFLSPYVSLGTELNVFALGKRNVVAALAEPAPFYLFDAYETGVELSVFAALHLVKMKKRCTCPRH
ncbi:MAG: hypothetical protein EAZ89_16525 [Bacteroidetes bacterium]|nr:MAG: hypothetical protein EAZ89_16525 [Bacteroidota bacterium]